VGRRRSCCQRSGAHSPGGNMPQTPTMTPSSRRATSACEKSLAENAAAISARKRRLRVSGSSPKAATCWGLSRIPRETTSRTSSISASPIAPISNWPSHARSFVILYSTIRSSLVLTEPLCPAVCLPASPRTIHITSTALPRWDCGRLRNARGTSPFEERSGDSPSGVYGGIRALVGFDHAGERRRRWVLTNGPRHRGGPWGVVRREAQAAARRGGPRDRRRRGAGSWRRPSACTSLWGPRGLP
jgi:hypothetical protein